MVGFNCTVNIDMELHIHGGGVKTLRIVNVSEKYSIFGVSKPKSKLLTLLSTAKLNQKQTKAFGT